MTEITELTEPVSVFPLEHDAKRLIPLFECGFMVRERELSNVAMNLGSMLALTARGASERWEPDRLWEEGDIRRAYQNQFGVISNHEWAKLKVNVITSNKAFNACSKWIKGTFYHMQFWPCVDELVWRSIISTYCLPVRTIKESLLELNNALQPPCTPAVAEKNHLNLQGRLE